MKSQGSSEYGSPPKLMLTAATLREFRKVQNLFKTGNDVAV